MTSDPKSQTCTSGDVTVEYFVHGFGDPILLYPGASLNSDYLSNLANALAQEGYCAIRVNPRGAGKSTGPSSQTSMKSFADDAQILIQHLNMGPVDIGGHAFGNRIARATEHYYPDSIKSVILFAAGGTVQPSQEAQDALQVILKPDAPEDDVLAAMRYMVGDPGDAERAWAVVKGARCPAVSAYEGPAINDPSTDWMGAPDHWPWLIVQGTKDQIAPPENGEMIKEKYGDKVELVSVEGAGHMMVVTEPEKATRAIMDFLDARVK